MAQSVSQQDQFNDTRTLLEQWAKWVMSGSSAPNILATLIAEPSKTGYWITDHDAGIVDQALARLKKKNHETGRTTISYFYHHQNATATAEFLRMDRKRVTTIVESGIAWVDAYLIDKGLHYRGH